MEIPTNPKRWLPQKQTTTFLLGAVSDGLDLRPIAHAPGSLCVSPIKNKIYPWACIFYISYVVIAVFVVVNLLVAVMLNNLETTRDEHLAEADATNRQHNC
ncbi:MAG TPA: ion transporter [Abditibacteriaceae bacterium]